MKLLNSSRTIIPLVDNIDDLSRRLLDWDPRIIVNRVIKWKIYSIYVTIENHIIKVNRRITK